MEAYDGLPGIRGDGDDEAGGEKTGTYDVQPAFSHILPLHSLSVVQSQ